MFPRILCEHISLKCRSKGWCLVISSSYDNFISCILGPFSYNATYLSLLGTFYNCQFFTVLMWSYHWQFRYPFVSLPLQEWTYSSPWHLLRYCCSYYFGDWNTSLAKGFPPLPSPWQMDILISRNIFWTLRNVVIVNPIHTYMV